MKKLLVVLLAFITTVSAFAGGKKDQAGSTLDQIKKAGVLTIGTEGTYPPYSYHNEADELVGYDVDIAKAIAAKLGVKAQFIESHWDSLIIGLDTQHWQVVINQVGITPQRQEKYDFTTPYTYTRGALIVRSDDTSISAFDDLAGKKSAQTVTSNWAQLAQRYGAELVGTDGFNQSIDLVLSGRADATINDDVAFYDYLKQHPNNAAKIAALSDDVSVNGVILSKNQPELLAAINTALDELYKAGIIKEISMKYFNQDISVASK
ncbi:MAG: amino acid ABC transporter substrate-binding protein [Treponema sp.]|jgi:cystine transport system substrate-binding protein|nr:amino acid ABC transporter substrate-binding protein [Treponema sp.]